VIEDVEGARTTSSIVDHNQNSGPLVGITASHQ
jgi:hypothetical protein